MEEQLARKKEPRSSTISYYFIFDYLIPYYTIFYYIVLYCTIFDYILLHYILYYIILYYTILYYIILYYTILYYIILYYQSTFALRGVVLAALEGFDAGFRFYTSDGLYVTRFSKDPKSSKV